jgi:hypothetical protein
LITTKGFNHEKGGAMAMLFYLNFTIEDTLMPSIMILSTWVGVSRLNKGFNVGLFSLVVWLVSLAQVLPRPQLIFFPSKTSVFWNFI